MKKNTKIILIIGIMIVVLLGYMIYPSIDRENTKEVDVGINPVKGNPDSEIVMIEFSDFQCPACKTALPIIEEIMQDYEVAFYYRNFPLPMHENSVITSEASECANEQGKFWEYHDVLFENQGRADKESLKQYAKEIGLDEEQFNNCLDLEKYKDAVQKDIKDGKGLKVKGTPTFFINNKEVLGANKEKIVEAIKNG